MRLNSKANSISMYLVYKTKLKGIFNIDVFCMNKAKLKG